MIAHPDENRQTTTGEHEEALIGSIVVRPSVLDELQVDASDFLDRDLGQAFAELVNLHSAGLIGPDYSATAFALRCQGVPETVWQPLHLTRMVKAAYDGVWAAYHAQEVRRASQVRRQQLLLARWAESLENGLDAPNAILERFTAEVQGMGLVGQPSQVRSFGEIARGLVAKLDERRRTKQSVGALSGILRLDETTGGWLDSELVILAARPGVGKTSFAMQIAMHNALKGRRVLVMSLEMRDEELIQRALCAEASVDSRRIRTGTYTDPDFDAIQAAQVKHDETPIRVYDASSSTVERLASIARTENARDRLSLIVVDYLQIIEATNAKHEREQQVSHQTKRLKALAKELRVPVICLSQFNRDQEKQNREPRLSDLRESGAIEQDADMVMALHRTGDGEAQIIVMKHRAGATGHVNVKWDAIKTTYSDPTELKTNNFNSPEPQWAGDWD